MLVWVSCCLTSYYVNPDMLFFKHCNFKLKVKLNLLYGGVLPLLLFATSGQLMLCILMDIRLLLQFSMRNPKVMVLSVALPLAPPEAILFDGLPLGAIDAIKAAYGTVVQILDRSHM